MPEADLGIGRIISGGVEDQNRREKPIAYKVAGAFPVAEVLEIAVPEMRLHLTDYHLESATHPRYVIQ